LKKVSFELGALANTWAFICVREGESTVSNLFQLKGIESAD